MTGAITRRRPGSAARAAVCHPVHRLLLEHDPGKAVARGEPRVDETVFGLVVERVGEHPLLLSTALERVLDKPLRSVRQRRSCGHEVAVTELAPQTGEIQDAMGGQRLPEQR